MSNNFDIGFVLHKKVVNCQQVKLGNIGGLFGGWLGRVPRLLRRAMHAVFLGPRPRRAEVK